MSKGLHNIKTQNLLFLRINLQIILAYAISIMYYLNKYLSNKVKM